MSLDFASINWLAVVASIVVGQVISTVWFVALFGELWAAEYGAASKEEHTKDVPGYTYAVGLLSTATLVLSLAVLQSALGVDTVGAALRLGLFVAVGFCGATMLPGQAFLKRWRVFAIAFGSQTAMILAISIVLAVWK